MSMKLITEITESVRVLEEGAGDEKNYFIEGIFLQGNIKNRNGRVYPGEVLNNQVEQYIESHVNTRRAFGELGHPDNPQINLERISHLITELKLDKDNWVGKAKLINEGMGRVARGILVAGGQLGVSSRALGSLVQREGYDEVQNDFHLVTAADIVVDPSAPEAFVRGIMEGREWICEGGIFKTVTPTIETAHKEATNAINTAFREYKYDTDLREEALVEAFKRYLSKIQKQ